MLPETKTVILEGLYKALIEATGNLYHVFTSMERPEDHEQKFMRGVEKHSADYERMIDLIHGRPPKK